MHPLTYFLAFWRLAPIQMVTWGTFRHQGIDTIDYYVSANAIEAAGSEQYYTQKLVRLPGYFMPRYRRPGARGAARVRAGSSACPKASTSYYCPQNLFKLHPDFDASIRAILERDRKPSSCCRSFVRAGGHGAAAPALRAHARCARIEKYASFPRSEHRKFLQYVAAADVVLDPFHFGGMQFELLTRCSLGVPWSPCPDSQLPGRFTLGLYGGNRSRLLHRPLGRRVRGNRALRLGRDAQYRRSVSEQISARCARLFDRSDAGLALGEELLRIAGTAG